MPLFTGLGVLKEHGAVNLNELVLITAVQFHLEGLLCSVAQQDQISTTRVEFLLQCLYSFLQQDTFFPIFSSVQLSVTSVKKTAF